MRFLLLLLLVSHVCFASHTDTLQIQLNKQLFQAGDTISFTAAFQPWIKAKKSGTLNVVMEDIHHTALWRFRYPVLEGETLADIILPADMPSDQYACYFSLQDDFFSMKGRVLSPYKDKAIKITMMLADKEFLAQAISLNEQKEFEIKKVLFADRAKVFFSPIKPNRTNDLEISLEVSLDSSFLAVDEHVEMITIGTVIPGPVANEFKFNPNIFNANAGTLQSVEVIGKKKTPIERFEAERVTGMFKTANAFMFDGNESNQFIGWNNILEWLRGRVAGLRIQPTGDGVNYTAQWQGGETYFFLNEMQVDAQTLATIPTSDIAYVKVFQPPFYGAYLGGAGGAIGVYTKDGSNGSIGPRNSFLVNGYTPETMKLPVKHAEQY